MVSEYQTSFFNGVQNTSCACLKNLHIILGVNNSGPRLRRHRICLFSGLSANTMGMKDFSVFFYLLVKFKFLFASELS